jgi:hypothetical protein
MKGVLKWEDCFNAAEGGRVNVAELRRMFGISRQSGYEWIGAVARPAASTRSRIAHGVR